MYLNYFGLTEKPFHSTPDPRFLYSSPSHREALAALIYGIEQRQGFATIVGEVGVGKTTILRAFLEHVNPELDRTIYIYNSNLTFKALLQRILDELDQEQSSHDVEEMIRQLQDVLIAQYRKKGTIVLLIDEAQNMPTATLENLRMLSNIETTTDKLLQIILIGQPELDTLLEENTLRQLRQRITLRTVIRPLTKAESLSYIQHRLAKSGAKLETVFERKAVNLIIRTAEGIPRRLNILCDNVLLTGFGYGQKPIPVKTVREVIADIDGGHSQAVMKWAPLSIAALLALVAIPWVYGTQDIFSGSSPEQKEVALQFKTQEDKDVTPTSNVDYRKVRNATTQKRSQSIMPPSMRVSSATDLTLAKHLPPPLIHGSVSLVEESSKQEGAESPTEYHTVQIINTKEKDEMSLLPTSETLTASTPPLESKKGSRRDPPLVVQKENPSRKGMKMPGANIHTRSRSQHAKEITSLTNSHSSLRSSVNILTYTIKSGDTLDSLLRNVYGRSSPRRMNLVLQHNPHIKSPGRLYPGQQLTFPALP